MLIRATIVAALAALGLALVPTANAETVTGTFRYADRNPTTGSVTMKPIARANVEIWRFAPGFFGIWSWQKVALTSTNTFGTINRSVPFAAPGVVYAVKVFATNDGATVWPNDAVHTVPFHQEPGQPDRRIINRTVRGSTDVLDFSYDYVDSWSAQHFNLAETVRQAKQYVTSRLGLGTTRRADVQPTSVTGSWFNPTAMTVVINSSEVFVDTLVLHEYAHWLEATLSNFAWIASSHDGCFARDAFGSVINSAEHAWMEGFADYFAQAVATTMPGLTGNGLPGTSSLSGLESPPFCVALNTLDGRKVEDMVAASLWDLFDRPGDPFSVVESHDSLSRLDGVILQIFANELNSPDGKWPTIGDFRSAWMSRGLPGSLDTILKQHRITVPPS